MPKYGDTEMTLIDLACHMSGLPRLPNNINRFSDYLNLNLIKNPYSSYTPQRLYAFLSKHTLKTKPGIKYSYSNLGMGLLGHALARRQAKTFEELVVSRICEPLEMKDTRITLSPEQQSRLAQGLPRCFHNFFSVPVLSGNKLGYPYSSRRRCFAVDCKRPAKILVSQYRHNTNTAEQGNGNYPSRAARNQTNKERRYGMAHPGPQLAGRFHCLAQRRNRRIQELHGVQQEASGRSGYSQQLHIKRR